MPDILDCSPPLEGSSTIASRASDRRTAHGQHSTMAAAACVGASEEVRTGRPPRLRAATVLLVLLLVVVWLISLSRSLFYPLGQDHAFFRYFTDMMMADRGDSVAVHLKYNPVFTGIQWLSIVLFGSSEQGFHAFDICWQMLTMSALVMLGGRDGRRWPVGLLAATLYAMAYYGMNYQVINGRDACAVLPLALMAHALVPAAAGPGHAARSASRCFLAGVMGFLAYMIKLPLGLGFGLLWLYLLAEAWQHRGEGRFAILNVAALTAGFLLSALAMGLLLMRVGWWDDFSPLFTNYQPREYTTGHWMMLELAPRVLLGSAMVAAVLVGIALRSPRPAGAPTDRLRRLVDLLPLLVVGAFVFGLFVTVRSWTSWRLMLLSTGGLLLPALGSVMIRPWRGRSVIWRMCLLLSCASLASIFLQGKFWGYHLVPLLAFAGYLAANELVDLLGGFNSNPRPLRAWTVTCVAAVVLLGLNTWWPRMTRHSTALNVLADCTLDEYHARVASHINHVPEYTTALAVSRRVRQLTAETDPIACLFLDTRIYYFSRRPMTHFIAFVFCRGWDQWYPEFMQAIREKRPKAVLARIPTTFRGRRDPAVIQPVIYDEVESKFGPPGKVIRECYRVTEVIDDVCILQPTKS